MLPRCSVSIAGRGRTSSRESPGDPLITRVRAAAGDLDDIAALSLPAAAEVFERVHGELQAALSDLDNT